MLLSQISLIWFHITLLRGERGRILPSPKESNADHIEPRRRTRARPEEDEQSVVERTLRRRCRQIEGARRTPRHRINRTMKGLPDIGLGQGNNRRHYSLKVPPTFTGKDVQPRIARSRQTHVSIVLGVLHMKTYRQPRCGKSESTAIVA
jgi:hypothetical protein